MFRRVGPPGQPVSFLFEGQPLSAQAGESVALALLAAGFSACRESVVSRELRGPYCLMGACFECLVAIDGVQNCQGCQVEVRDGMRVSRQLGSRDTAEASSE